VNQAESYKLKKIFGEIVAGFSIYKFLDQDVFMKHLGPLDDFLIAYKYEESYKDFLKRGIFNEEEKLEYLIKNNLWDSKKEDKIKNSYKTLEFLFENKRKVYSFNDIESYKKQIKEEEEFLNKLLTEKSMLIGQTAENLAQRETDIFIIKNYIFKDKKCEENLYPNEEFFDLTAEETETVFDIYKSFQNDLQETNIKKISINPLFTNLYFLSENPTDLFGQSLANLSHYQVRLITWAGYFKNISQTATIPESIKDDPEKIQEWYDGRANIEAILNKDTNANGVVSIGGITSREIKYYGLETPMSQSYERKASSTEVGSIEEAIRAGLL
jgi:hypothetical protein